MQQFAPTRTRSPRTTLPVCGIGWLFPRLVLSESVTLGADDGAGADRRLVAHHAAIADHRIGMHIVSLPTCASCSMTAPAMIRVRSPIRTLRPITAVAGTAAASWITAEE